MGFILVCLIIMLIALKDHTPHSEFQDKMSVKVRLIIDNVQFEQKQNCRKYIACTAILFLSIRDSELCYISYLIFVKQIVEQLHGKDRWYKMCQNSNVIA